LEQPKPNQKENSNYSAYIAFKVSPEAKAKFEAVGEAMGETSSDQLRRFVLAVANAAEPPSYLDLVRALAQSREVQDASNTTMTNALALIDTLEKAMQKAMSKLPEGTK